MSSKAAFATAKLGLRLCCLLSLVHASSLGMCWSVCFSSELTLNVFINQLTIFELMQKRFGYIKLPKTVKNFRVT